MEKDAAVINLMILMNLNETDPLGIRQNLEHPPTMVLAAPSRQ